MQEESQSQIYFAVDKWWSLNIAQKRYYLFFFSVKLDYRDLHHI